MKGVGGVGYEGEGGGVGEVDYGVLREGVLWKVWGGKGYGGERVCGGEWG